MYKRSFFDYLILYLKGLAMGTANKIPGVSGGMVALVTGFYEELIYSFQKLNGKAFRLLLNGRFSKFFEYINFKFLLAVNVGSVSAFFSISLLIDYFMRSPEDGGLGWITEVWSLFFGMIIGSVFYIKRRITHWNFKIISGLILGAALGLWISFLDPLLPNDKYLFIFLCGIVSVSGMTLPGFSGSFILIILGNYNLLLVEAVNNLFYTLTAVFQGDFHMLGTASLVEKQQRIRLLYIMIIFAVGGVVGLISFSKVMGYLLKHYHNLVIATLMGFIVGSLGAAWPWKVEKFDSDGKLIEFSRYIPKEYDSSFWIQIGCIILGILSIFTIEFFESRIRKQS